ncbi:fumarylacetoacetate hydrolase [Cohnella kolymensis]|uniref:Fumarylacetoacetate hydrolase n=1 Tax=Cohnella kolymensis TaxID=1590652 RepID=A0ABR5A4D4_9BACL|nr:fumarylacetoacetate hydrolase family protein [Cohnella kolymensis]KIL35493.1 fumarylacetoacetate hydrolase [Cohnella kolymensis]
MKLVQFREKTGLDTSLRLGALVSHDRICELKFQGTMKDLIDAWEKDAEYKSRVERDIAGAVTTRTVSEVQLCAPLTDPEKLIFVGLNYVDHAAESNMSVPEKPVLFTKFNNSIIGSDESVIIPSEVKQCDYEVELAVVIGRTAKCVSEDNALDYVFGYTVINDVSARDIQLTEGQWTRGKAIDTFAPLGPHIVTADEISDVHNLDIRLTLNGEIMQNANTKDLIFNVPYLVSFLSRTITLKPGDVISTGTPPGVGLGRTPPVWLKDGDVTEANIQGIGTLRNRFKGE